MRAAPARDPLEPAPPRAMGVADVVGFLVVAVVGVRWIATAAVVGPSALALWIVAGAALFVPLAFTVLELSSRHPGEGGIYVWCREAYGERLAFHAAWLYWSSNLTYFPGLLYFAAANALLVLGPAGAAWSASPAYFVAASALGLAVALVPNLLGLAAGKRLHNAGAVATWLPIAILIAMGGVALARFGSATPITAAALLPALRVDTLVFASTVAFAFAGFETASMLGGEIRDPRRTLPRAIAIAAAVIVTVYVLGTVAVLVALPPGEVKGLEGVVQAIDRVAARAGVPGLAPLTAALLAFGSVAGVGAWLAAVARLPYAAGLDGRLPPAFARVHPRWGTPVAALAVQGVGAMAFVLLSQAGATVQAAYAILASLTLLAYFVPYLLMFAALIRLQRVPAGPGVRRVPGGAAGARVLGGLGFATTAVAIVFALAPPAGETRPWLAALKIVGGTLVLAGIGEWMFRAGARRGETIDASGRDSAND